MTKSNLKKSIMTSF